MNLHYYFINPSTLPCVEAARKREMGVLVISPNDKGGHLWKNPQEMAELCAPLHPMQFNALFCWAQEGVHTLTMGAAQPSDLDLHAETAALYPQRHEWVAPRKKALEEKIATRLGQDWLKNWQTGIPYYYDSPGEINIFEILRIYTYGIGLGLESFAKARYNLLGKGGNWFPGNKAVDFNPTQIKEACNQSPYKDQIPELLNEVHRSLNDSKTSAQAGPRGSHH